MTFPIQLLSFVIFALALALGSWRWIRPQADALDLRAKGLLLLVILMVMGGFFGSFYWWFGVPGSFSWELPALAGRMLAAAGIAFAVIGVFVLERPSYRRLRLILILLFVYLVPLAVAAPLLHRERFDPSAFITYAFFAIVILMVAADIYYLLRQPPVFADGPDDLAPPATAVRTWLIIVAAITALWGLALFLTDGGPSDLIWVWSGDLLTSRLIGVMLLTIAAGALYSLPAMGTTRPMLAMILVYGCGLTLASVWLVFADKPIKLSYAVVFGLIAIISTIFLLRTGRT